jgi:hypothetical protein
MKLFYSLIFILAILINIIPEESIEISTKVAKIGNELILKKNVDIYAKFNQVPYAEAKKRLIDITILLTGAKMYSKEPAAIDVNEHFKKAKADYASKVGKEAKNVTDDEFIRNLNANYFSLSTYKNEIKKEIWINKYIDEIIAAKKLDKYIPTSEEINKLIKTKPELLQEKEGVFFSMIFISFYDDKGVIKKPDEIEKVNKISQDCLNELKKYGAFENMVENYSTDLVSKNNTPKGRVGFMAFDDPKAIINFSPEIINELKKSDKGIIYKIYKTKNGNFIFKIDQKVKPDILTGEKARLKAESILEKEYEINLKQSVMKEIIKDVSDKIEITIY